jgi:hypothetical protein
MHATPVPRSGTALPNLSSGSCCDTRPCERAFRLSSIRVSSISRFLSADFQPRGISGPHRPGDSFGFITCRLLRSASYPCRLRATAHPDRLPSSIRNPNLLSLLRVVPRQHASFDILCEFSRRCKQPQNDSTALSSLSAHLSGLCSHEHPDCIGPGSIDLGVEAPRPAQVCRRPLCLRFTVRRTESLSGAS